MNGKKMKPFHMVLSLIVAAVVCLVSANQIEAEEDTVIAGCATPVTSTDYSEKFVLDDFDVSGIILNDNGDLELDTRSKQLDPSNIEIPIEQEVSVTFLYENAGYTKTKFGWMYESDVIAGATANLIRLKSNGFMNSINDNNNAIRSSWISITTDQNGDTNKDGVHYAWTIKNIFSLMKITFPSHSSQIDKLRFCSGFKLDVTANPSCSGCWCGGFLYEKRLE